jgi:hypothetical protein
MAAECFSEKFGTVDTEGFGPSLSIGGLGAVHPEAEHRHTSMVLRMTGFRHQPLNADCGHHKQRMSRRNV